MTVSIIIPNYNGEQILEKNLPKLFALLKNEKNLIEVIVIDDGSTDGSFSFLEKYQKSQKELLKIMRNERNLGFSSTINNAVNKAKGEIVFLLNSDAYPKSGFLDPVIHDFMDESVFAVGCMDESIEGETPVYRGRGIGRWQRGFLMHSKGDVGKNNSLWASGGSSAFRKEIWDKLGGFNTLYNPFYWEDIDLSYRALKGGYKVLFEKKSIIVHEHEKGAIRRHYSGEKIKTIAYRNQFFFVWLNITDSGKIFNHILWLPYHLTRSLLRGDFPMTKGFLHAVSSIMKVLASRKKNIILFKKSDTDILTMFSE